MNYNFAIASRKAVESYLCAPYDVVAASWHRWTTLHDAWSCCSQQDGILLFLCFEFLFRLFHFHCLGVFWVMKAPFQVSRSLPNRQKTYNIELFWRVILAQRSLRNLRMPVTCFITAETVEDRTSWRKIQYSEDCA